VRIQAIVMFLLIGGNSEIGAATARRLREQGQSVVTTTRRAADPGEDELFLDLEQLLNDWRPPEGIKAACIFAAMARLAACEADWAGSYRVNVAQTLALAEKLIAKGIYTLFLSTNQVFDGTRAQVPSDAPVSPVSAYGRQKAATEAVFKTWIAAGAPAGILRLAKVVSPDMTLIHGWRRSLSRGEPIRAFHDMTMAPTPTGLVAQAISRLIEDREPITAQLTGPEDVSYAAVARFIVNEIGADQDLVKPVSALDNGMPASAVPLNTTLDSSYLARRYGLIAPDPWTALRAVLDA
jgi:dTDP-4-dehydrorhamnose reductase